MRKHLVRRTFAALAALALLAPATALAYERQWHAGGSLGYIGGWNGLGHGFGLGADLGYGVKDWLDLVGAIDVSYHPSSKVFLPTATVGGRVAFDVVQVVPHIGLMVGVALPSGIGVKGCKSAGCIDPNFDFSIPFGVDYQLSRKWTIGAAGRFQLVMGKGGVTPMMGAFAKLSYLWGY
jgi:opacity protein-like surface antigen